MQSTLRSLIVVLMVFLMGTTLTHAESSDFSTVVGTVDKFEKETLTIITGDKLKKSVQLNVTGTSKFHLLAPQVRSGKTVITQRSAEASDLVAGQFIAVIYTVADKENVLLTAVIKVVDKEKK